MRVAAPTSLGGLAGEVASGWTALSGVGPGTSRLFDLTATGQPVLDRELAAQPPPDE